MSKTPYRTPKGKDESLMPLPPAYKEFEGILTAHKYLNGVIMRGGNYTLGVLEEITSKMSRNKSVVINITGPPGVGKTWLAIILALLYDPKFHILDTPAPNPEQDHGQLCFTREHIRYLLGENTPLKRGQVIVLDEAHFGMGARSFQKTEQIDMVNLISAIRSKGFMLIIVTLHSSMLDKIPREYVVNYEFGTTDHGKAKPYFKWWPTLATKLFHKGKPVLTMPMPDDYDPDTGEGCSDPECLRCKLMKATGEKRCFNIRAIYERRKDEFINIMSANGTEESGWLSTEELFDIMEQSVFEALPKSDRDTTKKDRQALKAYCEKVAQQKVGIARVRALEFHAKQQGWSI